LHVELEHTDGQVRIVVRGELDLASAPALEEQLARAEEMAAPVIVVDLRELDFMDSTGLHVLLKAHQRTSKRGGQFVLVKGSRQIERLLRLTGVDERLTIVDSPEDVGPAGAATDS